MIRFGKTVYVAVGVVACLAIASPGAADPLRILLPMAAATVIDVDGNGTGDALSAGTVVSRTATSVQAALLEYDISGLTPGNVRWASVEFVLYPEQLLYTGDRVLGAYVYGGNGSVELGDFESPGVFVGKRTFTPGVYPDVVGWWMGFAVKHQVRAALEQGATSIGIRFMPLNAQPASALVNYAGTGFSSSAAHPPVLIVNPAPIPEPTTLLLVGSGVVALVARRRRSGRTP